MSGTSNTQLKSDIDELKNKYRETRNNQDVIFEQNGQILFKLNTIHDCLMGTEYDQNNGGGLVKKVNRNERACRDLVIWKEKSKTRNAIIWTIVGGGLTAIWGLMVTHWGKIFG